MSKIKPHDPRTKTSIIRGHMAAGDWRNAVRVAARLPRLDKHRAAVLDAQGAYENPGFYAQIGKDAATLIEAGAAALCERFGHNQESKTMTIELKNYSNASNARRAAKAAGLSKFDVFKTADGWYKIRPHGTLPIKPAKAAKPTKTAKPRQFVDETVRDGRKLVGKRAAALAAAQAGELPAPPDFSAPTHARYRDAAKALVDMAKAGDIEGLKAMIIKPYFVEPEGYGEISRPRGDRLGGAPRRTGSHGRLIGGSGNIPKQDLAGAVPGKANLKSLRVVMRVRREWRQCPCH